MKIDLSHIKEGSIGDFNISRFKVEPKDIAYQWGSIFKSGRGCPPGDYIKLTRGSTLVMSNTPDEIRDHREFIRRSTGSVLINGLGIGMCLTAVLQKQDVTDVTVIEVSKEVIDLVSPCFDDDRLTIINQSAFDYKPPKGKRYNVVWHDIWDFICTDNLEEMKKLHRKYGRKTDWQGSWCRGILEQKIRQEKLQSRYYSYF